MNEDERIAEDFRMNWHEAAHKRAVAEANQEGLEGAEREVFIKKREAEVYTELESEARKGLGF